MLDLFIEQIQIADGTGKPIYTTNVGIKDGKITYVGQESAGPGQRILKPAPQKVFCPGFIDSHGHPECYLFHDQYVTPKLKQGVTTEVSGDCRVGFAPVNSACLIKLKDNFESAAVGLDFPTHRSAIMTFGRFLDEIEVLYTEINTTFYVAHGAPRIAMKGHDPTPLTGGECKKVHEPLTEAMGAGVADMSTGSVYAPDIYADMEEIVDLCRIIGRYGGIYATHMKGEGDYAAQSVPDSTEVVHRTRVHLLISHHKVTGIANTPHIKEIHCPVRGVCAGGFSIRLDQYPYNAGETTLNTITLYYYPDGGNARLLERLEDPVLKKEIVDAILHNDGI